MIRCKDCKHLVSNIAENRGGSSIYRCDIARTECQPKREISRVRGPEEIPTKTSPRWCPLKKVKKDESM